MKKIFFIFIILLLILTGVFSSCYISSAEKTDIINSVKISFMHPSEISKDAAPDDFILYIWVLTIDDLENMENAQNPEELANYFYFRTFRYSIEDDLYGEPVNLLLNDIKVNDEYIVIANYVNTSLDVDIVFLSTEAFSVTEDSVTQVILVNIEELLNPPAVE